MKTLEIRNGDLVIGPGGHKTVSGANKLKQDLGIALRDPFGGDRFHPRWGTTLNDLIGGTIDQYTKMEVTSEVHRVVSNYVSLQQDAIVSSSALGRKPRFESGEVVEAVTSVDIRQTLDRLHIRIVLQTLSGQSVSLFSSIGA